MVVLPVRVISSGRPPTYSEAAFAMSTPVPLRSDFDTIGLRMLARRSRDPDQTRRLLALAEIYDGGSRPDAARLGGVWGAIVRGWGGRFKRKRPEGVVTRHRPWRA